jgi:hypothetical protein
MHDKPVASATRLWVIGVPDVVSDRADFLPLKTITSQFNPFLVEYPEAVTR